MKTIHKFPLQINTGQSVSMPADAKILSVQFQHGILTMWAEVDTEAAPSVRAIYIFGTGHPIHEDDLIYIGTVQQAGGNLVWHVYDGGRT